MSKKQSLSLLSIVTGIGLSVVAIGFGFAALHWVGAHLVIMEATSTAIFLALLWIYALPKVSPLTEKMAELKGTKAGSWLRMVRLVSYIVLASVVVFGIGILFKVLHYVGAEFMIMCGCVSLAFCGIFAPFFYTRYLDALEK